MASEAAGTGGFRLQRPIDPGRDHVLGGRGRSDTINVVVYGDYLCPYCRRLTQVLARLRQALGERLVYVFRHFPNERAHPGADLMARAAEAAARQGRFWDMHDRLYAHEPPLTQADVLRFAYELGLDYARFERDLDNPEVRRHVEEDFAEGKRNGITGTPTFFVDGMRYDGAWDFYSMLEALERPVAARLQRSARVFANLPASAGFVLLIAAALALLCANTPLAPYYHAFIETSFGIGPPGHLLSLTVEEWFSEGLLAIFFLLVGLEIRREMTAGALSNPRAALLPIIAAFGGVLVPTAIYLAFNQGATAPGWSVPTATDIAFTLGILALLGDRIPSGLRVFVAALAVVDDIISVLTLAIFYPRSFDLLWLMIGALTIVAMFALNRWRVYASWPYGVIALVLWYALHETGVHGALAGVFLAAFLPTRPAPSPAPLLAQAATALAALESAEDEARAAGVLNPIHQEPVWDWATRNLDAATERLLSPADRIERAVAPWSAYVILPLFAFSASGVALNIDLSSPEAVGILLGVVLGLVIGKPVGIALAAFIAVKLRLGATPDGVTWPNLIGGACLCGVGYTVALLLADQAFPDGGELAAIVKISVLIGSALAAALGVAILLLVTNKRAVTEAETT